MLSTSLLMSLLMTVSSMLKSQDPLLYFCTPTQNHKLGHHSSPNVCVDFGYSTKGHWGHCPDSYNNCGFGPMEMLGVDEESPYPNADNYNLKSNFV